MPELRPEAEWLIRIIPWRECEAWRQQGWEIVDLWPHHHGAHSMLAIRELEP